MSHQKKLQEDHIEDSEQSPPKMRPKDKYNNNSTNQMERISEADNEDEKYTTMFDKINEEALKEEFRLNEKKYR